MHKMRARAQIHFPSVLLTLISIIQALALELMWSKVVESEFLWNWSVSAVLGWGMIAVSFLGILQIWVMYSTMVMGFSWQPFLRDSILPFIIGIQEFMLISLISGEFNPMWLYVLASVFVSANWVSHNSLRRARSDPENTEFFATVKPATFRDHTLAIGIVTIFVLFGVATELSDNKTLFAFAGVLFANIALLWQIFAMRRLWRAVMGLNTDDSDANSGVEKHSE